MENLLIKDKKPENQTMKYCVGIGQDSHRFHSDASNKICVIGGLQFHEVPGFLANSDGDVIFHAICNAISSVTGIPIMGALADELCLKQGITDSAIYLEAALKTLKDLRICHIALTLEGLKPKFLPRLEELRTQIAHVMHIEKTQVGLTATTGEGLTDFGRGDGVQCFAIVTFMGI